MYSTELKELCEDLTYRMLNSYTQGWITIDELRNRIIGMLELVSGTWVYYDEGDPYDDIDEAVNGILKSRLGYIWEEVHC